MTNDIHTHALCYRVLTIFYYCTAVGSPFVLIDQRHVTESSEDGPPERLSLVNKPQIPDRSQSF